MAKDKSAPCKVFSRMPQQASNDRRLKLKHWSVLNAICGYCNAKGEAWPSQLTIAADTGRPRTKITGIVEDLTEFGYLTVEHRKAPNGRITSNFYRVTYRDGNKARVTKRANST